MAYAALGKAHRDAGAVAGLATITPAGREAIRRAAAAWRAQFPQRTGGRVQVRRLDGDDVNPGLLLAKEPSCARDGAAGANARNQDVDLAAQGLDRLRDQLVDRGAEILMIPAAFTLATGKDHWEPLVRARVMRIELEGDLVRDVQAEVRRYRLGPEEPR